MDKDVTKATMSSQSPSPSPAPSLPLLLLGSNNIDDDADSLCSALSDYGSVFYGMFMQLIRSCNQLDRHFLREIYLKKITKMRRQYWTRCEKRHEWNARMAKRTRTTTKRPSCCCRCCRRRRRSRKRTATRPTGATTPTRILTRCASKIRAMTLTRTSRVNKTNRLVAKKTHQQP